MGAWPSVNALKQHLDQGTDKPKLARAELAALVDKVNEIIAALAAASGACPLDSASEVPLDNLKLGHGNGLDADTLDGYHAGNAAGQIPVNNGSECATLIAAQASKLVTPRAITLGGDASGTVNFDGSAGVTLPVTVTGGSHHGHDLGAIPVTAGPAEMTPNSPDGSASGTTYIFTGAYADVSRNGSLRISFTMAASFSNGRIYRYRSGVATAVGTERYIDNDSAAYTYVQDISGWQAGDQVRIYGKESGPNPVQISNLKIGITAY